MKLKRNGFTIISIVWVISLLVFIYITELNRSSSNFTRYLIIPFIGYFGAIIYLEKTKCEMSKKHWILFWTLSIFIRVFTLLFSAGLSDDVYRYIWDGKVQQAGINPYLYSPDSVELINIREDWWGLINNGHVPTPYPPLSQLMFWIMAILNLNLSSSILLFRMLMLITDLGLIYLLLKFIRYLNIPSRRIVIYAWSPLSIFEFAGNGHNDIIAIFFMVLAIYLTIISKDGEEKFIFAAFFLALAILIKIFPVFVFPFLLKHWRKRDSGVFLGTLIIISIPYYSKKILFPIIPPGQILFIKEFRFNESFFRILEHIFSNYTSKPSIVTRVVVICFVVMICIIQLKKYWLENFDHKTPEIYLINSLTIILFSLLLLGPEIHPWYILWILPLTVISPHHATIIWSATVLLSYTIYPEYDTQGIWEEKTSILIYEYLPIYLTIFYQFLTKLTKKNKILNK